MAQLLVTHAGDQLIKMVIILCSGTVATVLFTAQTAVVIRAMVKTEMKEVGSFFLFLLFVFLRGWVVMRSYCCTGESESSGDWIAVHRVGWGGMLIRGGAGGYRI